MGSIANDKCPYKRQLEEGNRGEEGHVKMEAGLEDVATSQGCLEPLESRRGRKGCPLRLESE